MVRNLDTRIFVAPSLNVANAAIPAGQTGKNQAIPQAALIAASDFSQIQPFNAFASLPLSSASVSSSNASNHSNHLSQTVSLNPFVSFETSQQLGSSQSATAQSSIVEQQKQQLQANLVKLLDFTNTILASLTRTNPNPTPSAQATTQQVMANQAFQTQSLEEMAPESNEQQAACQTQQCETQEEECDEQDAPCQEDNNCNNTMTTQPPSPYAGGQSVNAPTAAATSGESVNFNDNASIAQSMLQFSGGDQNIQAAIQQWTQMADTQQGEALLGQIAQGMSANGIPAQYVQAFGALARIFQLNNRGAALSSMAGNLSGMEASQASQQIQAIRSQKSQLVQSFQSVFAPQEQVMAA
ncbi:MAG: hypothetical protein VKJ04_11630 [Vampirovibrionales bacterium]|nr:hypothetical protein [Vampirovibrionales bacterium]